MVPIIESTQRSWYRIYCVKAQHIRMACVFSATGVTGRQVLNSYTSNSCSCWGQSPTTCLSCQNGTRTRTIGLWRRHTETQLKSGIPLWSSSLQISPSGTFSWPLPMALTPICVKSPFIIIFEKNNVSLTWLWVRDTTFQNCWCYVDLLRIDSLHGYMELVWKFLVDMMHVLV